MVLRANVMSNAVLCTCFWHTCVLVGAIWTVHSSVVELLTRVAGVLGSISGPGIRFQCIDMLIPLFILQLYIVMLK